MTEDDSPPKQHSDDIFRVGDEVPWYDGYAVITDRSLAAEIPDEVPDHGHPGDFTEVEREDDAEYVVLTLGREDDEDIICLATWLIRHMGASFNKHGLPSVQAKGRVGIGESVVTRVQTPGTGSSHLDGEGSERLATFLREHKDFEPLYALLGGTDSPEDVEAIANALEQAAKIHEFRGRQDDE